jgi:hypothetical protein
MQRLLRRAALAVDGRARHAFGKLRSEDGITRNVGGLLAGLVDAAHDHVFDQRRVGAGSFDQGIEYDAGEIGWMPPGQSSAFAASGRTGGGYDICFCHVHVLRLGRLDPASLATGFSQAGAVITKCARSKFS